MSDYESRLKIIDNLAKCYRAKTTEELLESYERSLADIPLQRLKEACEEVKKRCKFFPSICEIRELLPVYRKTAYSLPRPFQCGDCHDNSGFVEIWAPEIIDLIFQGEITPDSPDFEQIHIWNRTTRHKTLLRAHISSPHAVVICECETGRRKKRRKGCENDADYNPRRHCKYSGVENLVKWIEEYANE